ncbi:hypothetical protein [Methylocaldum sp. GT1TLB]|uniref:hypothetical protein n=1 Tax=Methylocaldum sp. GT1TLB TaxID=3438965 RepID=UPI003DA1C852
MRDPLALLRSTDFPRITRKRLETLQVDLGYRCNLRILEEPGHKDLARFLAERRVEIVASLPRYLEQNADAQRGKGVFDKSLRALHKLNRFGYGGFDSGLMLNLVYNPQGGRCRRRKSQWKTPISASWKAATGSFSTDCTSLAIWLYGVSAALSSVRGGSTNT